jgi:hypothetical protein
MSDSQTERVLSQFTQELRQLLGDELIAVELYGSGAGVNFIPGASDLNVVIVVRHARFDIFQKLQPRMADWHRQRFALPLVVDQEFLQHGCDVFPMEIYDIKEQHRLLWGEDVFGNLPIDARHLRYQAEHEARSKLLRLQALYLECAGDLKRLHALMLDSLKTFLILMRNLLRMHGQPGSQDYEELLTQFERYFGSPYPHLRQLLTIRAGRQGWPTDHADQFFCEYLTDVQQLVSLIDRLPTDRPLPRESRD